MRMYPACAIDEYARMRLTSDCTTAAMLPNSSDSTARTHTIGRQSSRYCGKATVKSRSSAANAAALVAAAMNAVTGVGAPWYTSGVHMWNGTAETLNPRPTMSSPSPNSNVDCSNSVFLLRNSAIHVSDVVPVAPYTSATP